MLSHTLRVSPGGRRDDLTAKELDEFLYRLSLLSPLDALAVKGKVGLRGRVIEMWATISDGDAETARLSEQMRAEVTVPPHEPDDLMPGYSNGDAPDTLAIAPGDVRLPPRAQLGQAPKHRR